MGDTAGRAAPPPGAARPPAARSGARAARGGVGRSDSPRAGGADELRSPGEAGDGRRRTEVLEAEIWDLRGTSERPRPSPSALGGAS